MSRSGKPKSEKRLSKKIKIPIKDTVGDLPNHVTYENVETVTYESPENGVKCKLGHLPFNEVETKHSGYVNDHCGRMTELELVDDFDDKQQPSPRQVNIDSKVSVISRMSTTRMSSVETRASVDVDDNPSDQKSQHLQLDPQVDSIDVDAEYPDDHVIDGDFQKARPPHIPWDEFELKEHGLLDAGCHHKILPEDDVQLHREGKIDDFGHRVRCPGPIHQVPYDEIKMKHIGYVDDHGRHLTKSVLNDEKGVAKIPAESRVNWSTPTATSLSNSSSRSLSINEESDKKKKREKKQKLAIDEDQIGEELKVESKRKKSKAQKRKRSKLTLNVRGFLRVTEAKPPTGAVS